MCVCVCVKFAYENNQHSFNCLRSMDSVLFCNNIKTYFEF